MNNNKVMFPYYSGNIYKPQSLGLVNLEYFIESIKNPDPKFTKLFDEINLAAENKDVKLKRRLKQQLYSFTPSVIINRTLKRNYGNVSEFTGLMQIDLDGIETISIAEEIKNHIFENNKQIVCAFLSPSGKGVKCLMRIKKPKSVDDYKALHKGMENKFEEYGYLDSATKNAVLPMFLSRDKKILYRDFSECEEWINADNSKTDYVRLNEAPTTSNISYENKSYYFNKVVEIINKRFSNIVDNGHPQVRSTCLVLGSRVAAGYIDRNEAESLAKNNIISQGYLSKNINGYLKTAYWAINEGMKSPKYF